MCGWVGVCIILYVQARWYSISMYFTDDKVVCSVNDINMRMYVGIKILSLESVGDVTLECGSE